MKVGFIGGGNMARAIAGGLLAGGFEARDLLLSEPLADRRKALAEQLPLAKVWRLRFNRQSRDECRFLLLDLVRHHLEKDLKSLRLLSQIGALEATKSSVNL